LTRLDAPSIVAAFGRHDSDQPPRASREEPHRFRPLCHP
jgi:hypothetical protein